MKKIFFLFIVFFTTATLQRSFAQEITDEAGVRACLEEYMSGDGNRMEKAFHSSATMKYIDVTTGEFKDVPIADFIARAKANTNKSERKIDIVSVNIEGTLIHRPQRLLATLFQHVHYLHRSRSHQSLCTRYYS